MSKRWVLVLSSVLVSATALAAADGDAFQPKPFDWPQWSGPNRDAVCKETGLLQSWPADGPPLTWTAKELGTGFSGPAIAAGRIFGMSARGSDEVMWALEESSGKELWSTPIAAAKPTKLPQYKDVGPRCTPTVDGELVYGLGVSGDLACLEVATGKLRWQKNLVADFGGKTPGWGYSESPLVDGDKLICTPGGKDATLVALNKATGDVVWKGQVPEGDGAAYSSIVVSEGGGVRQYVQLLAHGVVGLATEDGKYLWRYDRVANGVANIDTPIVHGDEIFVSTSYNGGSALLQLTHSGDGVKAKEVYYLAGKIFQSHHGGVVLVDDYVYGGHGQNNGFPVCIKWKTGEVMWRKDRGPGTGSAAVLYADHRLYFRYQDGTLALLEATPDKYHLVSSFKLPDNSGQPSWPHPVIANGKLYIRDQNKLLCFDVKQQ